MLKHLTEDTCKGNWSVICWVSFIPFLKIGDMFAAFQMDGSLPVSRDFDTLVAGWGQVLYERSA